MISFDFAYYKPHTLEEALHTYREYETRNKRAVYFAGGTETISRARLGKITMDAVIDLKGIPECNLYESGESHVIIGSAVSMSRLTEETLYPLLSRHARGVADHTSRNRITIGGNIAGKTCYREAVLPLLLADSQVVVARHEGLAAVSIHDVFDRQLLLKPGEFIVQFRIERKHLEHPFVSIKKTRFSKIDYPLVSLAATLTDNRIRIALSGVCDYPFRSKRMEEDLNVQERPAAEKIENAIRHLPDSVVDDLHGSSEYRKFVLYHALSEVLMKLEGGAEDGTGSNLSNH